MRRSVVYLSILSFACSAQAQTVEPTSAEGQPGLDFMVQTPSSVDIPTAPRTFKDEVDLANWLRTRLGVRLLSADKEGFSAVWLGEEAEEPIVTDGLVVRDPVLAVLAGRSGEIIVGDLTLCLDTERGCTGPTRSYLSSIRTEATGPDDLPEFARVCAGDDESFCIDVRSEQRGATLTAKTSMKWGANDNGRVIVGAYFEEDQNSKIVSLRDEDGARASETVRVWETSTKPTTLWCGYHWAESGDGQVIGPFQTAWNNPQTFGNEGLACPDPEVIFDIGGGDNGDTGDGDGDDDGMTCPAGTKMCEPPPFLICVPEGAFCP